MTSSPSAQKEFIAMVPCEPPSGRSVEEIGESLRTAVLSTVFSDIKHWRDEVQRDLVALGAMGKNIIAQLPTGFGKTVIALVPAIAQGGVTVIVSPTLSLIDDIHRTCLVRKILCFKLTGSSTHDEQALAANAIVYMQGRIVLTTPEMAGSHNFQELMRKQVVRRVVWDEAHTVLEWAPWRMAYKQVDRWLRGWVLNRGISVTFLSATLNSSFYQNVFSLTGVPLDGFERRFKSLRRSNVRMNVVKLPKLTQFVQQFIQLVQTLEIENCAIIYIRSARKAEELCTQINEHGIQCGTGPLRHDTCRAYHSKLEQDEKQSRLRDWKRGNVRVLIGTEAISVGIDHRRIELVVHCGMPASVTSYTQHVGRAARSSGILGRCVLMYALNKDIPVWALLQSLPRQQHQQLSGHLHELQYTGLSNDSEELVLPIGTK